MNNTKMIIVCMIFSVLMVGGCALTEKDWTPRGEISIMDYHQYTDSYGGKKCRVFYSISNTGLSEIQSVSVSFKIDTEVETYYQTVDVQKKIGVSNRIYSDFAIELVNLYITNSTPSNAVTNLESVTDLSDIRVTDSYFD